jgi:hypothetical protein
MSVLSFARFFTTHIQVGLVFMLHCAKMFELR